MQNRKIESKAYSVGEFLRRPINYRVPSYQRDYAWTLEQVDMLWNDIITSMNEDRTEYFLGAIVTSYTDDDKKRDIVDGQQRLATLSMIFAAISKKWHSFGDDQRALGVSRDYIGVEDRRTKLPISKLKLNETNDPVYESVIIRGESINKLDRILLSQSNKLFVSAYERIQYFLDQFLANQPDTENSLLDLESYIADTVNLIVIEAGDESDAFITFETLNDRGLDLAISDLVKNFLFSKAKNQSEIDVFKKTWTEIVLLVGAENLTQFIRYFWNAEYDTSRERDLYSSIKKTIKNNAAALVMIKSLRRSSELYAALSNPEHAYWNDFPNEYREYLEALLLFKVTQYRPVALAAMTKLKPDQMTRLLRVLMVISFRYTVISALNTGNLEKVYSKTALSITGGAATNIKSIFDQLKSVYVDDEQFVADFQHKHFTKDEIARYILREIDSYKDREIDIEHVPADRSGRLTIEHIYPKNPKEPWPSMTSSDVDPNEYLFRIGNLTLLENAKNRNIANQDYSIKKAKALKMSKLSINQCFNDISEWNPHEIESRSRAFASIAKSIWRIDA